MPILTGQGLLSISTLLLQTVATAGTGPELLLSQSLLPPDSAELLATDSEAGLKLRLEASFSCPEPEAEAQLHVSVADTIISAPAARSPQMILVTLPPAQLQGVRESLACPGLGPQLRRAQLTAYATLSCRSAGGEAWSTTVSRPLDLWVDCGEPPAAAPANADPESPAD